MTAVPAGVGDAGLVVVLAAVPQLETLTVTAAAVRVSGDLSTPPTTGGDGPAEGGEVLAAVSSIQTGGVAVTILTGATAQTRTAPCRTSQG